MVAVKEKMLFTFENPVSFVCLDKCGLCCSYKVHLDSEDIRRIEFSGKLRSHFFKSSHMPKKEGFCCFLDSATRCGIYADRPKHCRNFPFYCESPQEIDIDLSCPGIGQGSPVSQEYFERLLSDFKGFPNKMTDKWKDVFALTGRSEAVVDYNAFTEIGLKWCSQFHNLKNISQLAEEAEQSVQLPNSIAEGISLGSHDLWNFNELYNVHLDLNMNMSPVHYRSSLNKNFLTINNNKYELNEDSEQMSCPRCFKYILRYLKIWFRRSLFYNFCMATSLQLPMFDNCVKAAFSFVACLVKKIKQVQQRLKKYWAEQNKIVDDLEMFKESIRFFDGRLRTKIRTVAVNEY